MSNLEELIVKGFQDSKTDRSIYDIRNQDIVDYVSPDRGDFNQEVLIGGEDRSYLQYDSTATIASQDLVSILISGLIKDDWFKFEFEEVNESLKVDLEKLSKGTLKRFKSSKSNFNLQAIEFVTDIVHFGYACMQVDISKKKSTFQTIHPAQVWFEEDEFGKPDVVYRQYKLTLRQAYQKWGDDIGKESVKQLESAPNDKIKVLHCVMPNKDFIRMGGTMKNKNHKYASITMLVDRSHIIKVSGFKKIPYIISRWNKRSGEVYGIGISGQLISHIKLLNVLVEIFTRSEEKAADPMMLTTDEAPFLPLEAFPGSLLIGGLDDNGQEMVKPFPTQGTRGSKIDVVIGKLTRDIESAYFVEQFRQREGVQPLTATETLDNRDKRLTLISPYSERLKTEWLQEIILMEGDQAVKNLDVSPQLNDEDLYIRYLGSLSFTENSEKLLSYNRFFAHAASFIQLNPEVISNLRVDSSIRDIAELSGIPLDIIKGEEERKEETDSQQVQQQQAEQIAQLESSAKSSKDLNSAGVNLTE